ncbi:MAG: DUF1566 domain-containing protein [Candidatus Methylumidiphilus sp.]
MTLFNQPTKPNFALTALLFAVGLFFASTAEAALMSRLGGQVVYDTDYNITWLANANYAQTSGYDTDGLMNWTDANAWAASLNIGGYTGWRLPIADPACVFSYGCINSELGHLYYTEGGLSPHQTIASSVLSNMFTNMKNSVYWSSTGYAPGPGNALDFDTNNGYQDYHNKDHSYSAWAVRSGDVAASVPEPGMIWLFGAGALAWSGSRTRRRG